MTTTAEDQPHAPSREQWPRCPGCTGVVKPVCYNGGYLNEEQWASQRAGDWYCEVCPPNDRSERNKFAYWWDQEVAHKPQPDHAPSKDQSCPACGGQAGDGTRPCAYAGCSKHVRPDHAPSTTVDPFETEFNEWWAQYPAISGYEAALDAWAECRGRFQLAEQAEVARLTAINAGLVRDYNAQSRENQRLTVQLADKEKLAHRLAAEAVERSNNEIALMRENATLRAQLAGALDALTATLDPEAEVVDDSA